MAGYCVKSVGGPLIQRGDYKILKPDDDQIIDPSQIGTVLQPGVTVEMGIVLREQAGDMEAGGEYKCPRCRHMNIRIITNSGWVNCQKCGGHFNTSLHDDFWDVLTPKLYTNDAAAARAAPEDIPFFRRIFLLHPNVARRADRDDQWAAFMRESGLLEHITT
ncbi:hypothetical protein HWV62_3975 [Athelia sp. TMB]|nr:hypothetical protein HWV62_3975 [Athelia sp. TMB]